MSAVDRTIERHTNKSVSKRQEQQNAPKCSEQNSKCSVKIILRLLVFFHFSMRRHATAMAHTSIAFDTVSGHLKSESQPHKMNALNSRARVALQTFAVFLMTCRMSGAFAPQLRTLGSRSDSIVPLFGISEWRATSLETNRTLLLLPFKLEETLVPGQSHTVVLKEGRYFDMLDEATEDHASVIGTIIMGDDALMPIISLCEISSYSLEAGYRGKVTAIVTLKCAGRAKLLELKQVKPVMKGRCEEVLDDADSSMKNLDYANELVSDIEQLLAKTKKTHMYQHNFWLALSALGYKPTSLLLSRDPSKLNAQKEIEAASWAAVSVLDDKCKVYTALKTTDLIERLQIGLRASMADFYSIANNGTAVLPSTNFESGFE